MDNCKICGTAMENFECYDSEYTQDIHHEYVHAYCPKCKKYYKWVEIYIFSHIEDFDEEGGE